MNDILPYIKISKPKLRNNLNQLFAMKNLILILGLIATTSLSAQAPFAPDTCSQVNRFYVHDFPYNDYKFGEITLVTPDGSVISFPKTQLRPNDYIPIKGGYLSPGTMVILDIEDKQGNDLGSYTAYITQSENGDFNRKVVEPNDLVDLIVFTGTFFQYSVRGYEDFFGLEAE